MPAKRRRSSTPRTAKKYKRTRKLPRKEIRRYWKQNRASRKIAKAWRKRKAKKRAKRVNKAISRLMTSMEGSTIRRGFKYAWGCGGQLISPAGTRDGQVGSSGGHNQWMTDHNNVRVVPPIRHNELMYMQVDSPTPVTDPNYTLKPTFPDVAVNLAGRLNSPFITNEHLQVQDLFTTNKHCVAFKQFPMLPPIPPDYERVIETYADTPPTDGYQIEAFECRKGDKIRIKNNYIKLAFNVTPDQDRHWPQTTNAITTNGTTAISVVSGSLAGGTGTISTSGSGNDNANTTTWPSYMIDKKEWYVDVRIIMAERPLCGDEEFNFSDIVDYNKTKIKYQTTDSHTYTGDTDQEKIAKAIFNAKYTDKTINEPGSEQNRERKIFKDEKFRIDWRGRHKTNTKIYNLMKSKVLEFTTDTGDQEIDSNSAQYNLKTQYAFIVMLHTYNCRCFVEQSQVLTFDK